MSMVGGYPVGARAVAALCQEGEITPQEAARMLCFCVNSGPAFVLSVVGAGLLRNAQAGVILLASQLSASLLLGILCSLGVSRKQRGKATSQKGMGAAQALICSASDAARSMLSMCCFVILFAVLLDLLRVFLSSPTCLLYTSLPKHPVQKRALSHIGAAYDRNKSGPVLRPHRFQFHSFFVSFLPHLGRPRKLFLSEKVPNAERSCQNVYQRQSDARQEHSDHGGVVQKIAPDAQECSGLPKQAYPDSHGKPGANQHAARRHIPVSYTHLGCPSDGPRP